MKKNFNLINKKDLLIKLIETGIKLWIKSKCNAISEIKLYLNTSTKELLKGTISSIDFEAEKVNLKDIIINKVLIKTDHVEISSNFLTSKVSFRNEIKVNLMLIVSEESLEKTLLSDQWNWLGDLICNNLTQIDHIQRLNIIENKLELYGESSCLPRRNKGYLTLSVNSGKLVLINEETNKNFTIPMEESIYITKAYLNNKYITVYADAKIK
tara:strand:- start:251 stop:886 length:636 start_codon:yes stop_codon:yes gene_type:complete